MYDMTIRLRTDSDKCLYQQIYEHIRQEIREGKLLAGERLPSTRSLAEYLQVARSTVDYAYDQLLSEGYIEARPIRDTLYANWRESSLWSRKLAGCRNRRHGIHRQKTGTRKKGLTFLPMESI